MVYRKKRERRITQPDEVIRDIPDIDMVGEMRERTNQTTSPEQYQQVYIKRSMLQGHPREQHKWSLRWHIQSHILIRGQDISVQNEGETKVCGDFEEHWQPAIMCTVYLIVTKHAVPRNQNKWGRSKQQSSLQYGAQRVFLTSSMAQIARCACDVGRNGGAVKCANGVVGLMLTRHKSNSRKASSGVDE